MRHAFLINAHKDMDLLVILISQLSFGDIYIHIDEKADALYQAMIKRYEHSSNVKFIKERVNVNWSGFSQVRAILQLLRAVSNSDHEYDYIHFISGQDLLLMNHKKLDNLLLSYGEKKEFIDYDEIGSYAWRIKNYSLFRENKKNRKLIYRVVDILLRLLQLPFHRKNLQGYQLYKGSSWFSITQPCLYYILEKAQDENFIKQFDYTACSDEHFFQIVVLNSQFKDAVVNQNLRYVEFKGYQASPIVLKREDKAKFMNGKYAFARKFDLAVDRDVVLEIQAESESV